MTHLKKSAFTHKERLITFDLLRGFFILVIVIDHLQRWPGVFDWLTGQGRLWASAAEGFILISGLMLGLIRGHKDKDKPFSIVAKRILYRAFTLYIWALIITFITYILIKYYQGQMFPYPPGLDSFSKYYNDMLEIFTLQATLGWTIFLMYYAVFLALAPLAIYLLRKNMWWLVLAISFCVWLVSLYKQSYFLSWQLLFFNATVFGFYFYTFAEKWRHLKYRKIIKLTVISFALITLFLSVVTIFGWNIVKSSHSPISLDQFIQYREFIDQYFIRKRLLPPQYLIALSWFATLYFIFHKYEPFINKWFGWLLLQFGYHSLFIYILQGILILPLSMIVLYTPNIIINVLITLSFILILWALTKIKLLHKFIPS